MLYYTIINRRTITARPEFLKRITEAHRELVRLNLGIIIEGEKYKGLVIGAIETSSWRSEAVQKDLYDRGKTPIMTSNHRRGTAIDVFPDHNYIEQIEPILRSYGLVNDITGDAVHFNYKSNDFAKSYDMINLAESKEYKGMIVELKQEKGSPHIYQIIGDKKFMVLDMFVLDNLFGGVEIIQVDSLDDYKFGGTINLIERLVN